MTEQYWERFTKSGRIEDYLAYRNSSAQNSSMEKQDRDDGENERNRDSDGDDRSVISGERVR